MTGVQAMNALCEEELARARLEVFACSVFREYAGNSTVSGKAAVKQIFSWRLMREYRHFLRNGLSPNRAAAAAIGRADNFLHSSPGAKKPSWVFPTVTLPAVFRGERTAVSKTVSLENCEKDISEIPEISIKNTVENYCKDSESLPENLENPGNISVENSIKANKKLSGKSIEREDKEKMKNSLRVYVDSLFNGAPETASVRELHDEILSNLEERYDDCIAGGMTPQRAYTAVVGTMGDIGKLIRQVSEEGQPPAGLFERSSPTGKGVFKKYSYIFTEKNLKIIKRSAIAVMWILLTAFYFLVSFTSDMWDRSWIIFLVGAGLNVAINMAGDIARFSRLGDNADSRVRILKSIRGSLSAILWLAATFMFFMIGMTNYYLFDRAWVIFILAAAVQIILSAVMKIQINRYTD